MMKFVNILPTEYIDKPWCWTSNIHLPLAHLIEDGNEYTEKFKKLDAIKVLDNGFFEIGKNVSIKELIEKADLINAHYIVLPDTFYSEDFEDKIIQMIKLIPEHIGVFGIPLGKNLEESLKAFEILNYTGFVDNIAIPDRLLSKWTGITRLKYLRIIHEKYDIERPLHMLALDDYRDLPKLRQFETVQSIDSTIPFKMGWAEVRIGKDPTIDVSRPKNYFDIKDLNLSQISCIRHNIGYIKEVLK